MAKLYWLGLSLILIAILYQYRREIQTLVLKSGSESSKSPTDKRENIDTPSRQEENSGVKKKKVSEQPSSKDKEATESGGENGGESEKASNAPIEYYNPPFDPNNPPEPFYSKAGTRMITLNELAAHGHSGPLKPLWLCIMGRVYNVDKGAEHYYGPNGGYKFFTGKKKYRIAGNFSRLITLL